MTPMKASAAPWLMPSRQSRLLLPGRHQGDRIACSRQQTLAGYRDHQQGSSWPGAAKRADVQVLARPDSFHTLVLWRATYGNWPGAAMKCSRRSLLRKPRPARKTRSARRRWGVHERRRKACDDLSLTSFYRKKLKEAPELPLCSIFLKWLPVSSSPFIEDHVIIYDYLMVGPVSSLSSIIAEPRCTTRVRDLIYRATDFSLDLLCNVLAANAAAYRGWVGGLPVRTQIRAALVAAASATVAGLVGGLAR